MRKLIYALLLLTILAPIATQAQVATSATPVQQSATRADAATVLYGPAGGATSCNTVNTTVVNNTVTIPAVSGFYFYVTGVYVDITANTTGTTGVATLSATNIAGTPFWSLATIVPTAGANGTFRQIAETYPTALRSSAPGTSVVFAPSAQAANTIFCIRVAGYYGL